MPKKKKSSKVKKEPLPSTAELEPQYHASHTGFRANDIAFLMLTEGRDRAIKGVVISDGIEEPEGSEEFDYQFVVENEGQGPAGSWIHRQISTVSEKELRFNLDNTEPYGPGYAWIESPEDGKDVWVSQKRPL